MEQAVANEKTAQSNLNDARARLKTAQTVPQALATAESSTEELAAEIKQNEADLAQAEKNLADTKIIAPLDGMVTNRG
ncbi:hypothetical protein ACI3PF_20360, partial [Lactococcus lactis]